MNVEIVNTEWFDPEALRLPDYKVGRVYYGNGRSYLRISEDGELEKPFRLYTSLTTAINQCAPMERQLLEWYAKLGMVEADRYLKMSQHYGTLMHMCIGDWLKQRYFEFSSIQTRIDDYLSEHSYFAAECADWPKRLSYDMVAFIQFTMDYNIAPQAIEFVLLSRKRGFGTLIDLVCKLDMPVKGFHGEVYATGERKGLPKETTKAIRKTAVINFKSGRHAFYRSNGIQIEAERQLFEENFQDIKIDCALNWSPKDWETTPGYNLKDWSGDISDGEVDAVLKLAQIRYGDRALRQQYVNIFGTAWRDKGANVVHIEDVEQYCKRHYSTEPA